MLDRETLLASLLVILAGVVAFRLLGRPLIWTLGMGVRGLVGGVALWGLNVAGGLVGINIGLNPATALVVGLLGFPGIVLLLGLRLLTS